MQDVLHDKFCKAAPFVKLLIAQSRLFCTHPSAELHLPIRHFPSCVHLPLTGTPPFTAGKSVGVEPLVKAFPPELVDAIRQAWRLGVQREAQLGPLHEEVSRVLWRLGVLHRNQCILADGMICVDIALEGDRVRGWGSFGPREGVGGC